MPTMTADAVVIGGGHHGLVAAACSPTPDGTCACWSRPTLGGAIRSAELHPGFTADLFSAFYPLSRGLPGAALAGAGPARAALGARPQRARPPAAPGRRTGRGAAPGPGGHRGRAGRARPAGRRGLAAAVRAVGPNERPGAGLAVHRVPPGPRSGAAAAPARHRRRAAAGPVPAAAGPPDGRGAVRRRGRPGCCWPATPCTPTPRRTPRAAASSAGCWPCSGQQYGFPVPVGGSGELAAALARRAASAGAPHPHRAARRADRGARRPRGRRAHRGRADRAGPPGGARRRVRARPLPADAAGRRAARAAARRPGAVRVGHPGGQGQLGAGRPIPWQAPAWPGPGPCTSGPTGAG